MTRAAGIRNTFLLAAALIMGQAAHAQWCPNNPAAGSSDTCLGDYSLQSTIAAGCCGVASADTAVGFGTLMHNTTGAENTAIGSVALYWSSTASYNTAVGYASLMGNQTGEGNTALGAQTLEVSQGAIDNTALGYLALNLDTTGYENTATGAIALINNQTGNENSALGYGALYFNGSGSLNTAIGGTALASLTSGSNNLALGVDAGRNYSGAESNNVVLANRGIAGESGVTRIGSNGTQTRAFIAGIYGATSSSGTWVLVNSAGQLGTTTSSRRFKEAVADMGAASSDLMRLRPVTFRYKPPYDDGQGTLQYGLIAEEVAAVNPGLVQFGEDGQPLAVRYHFVYAMLLNEVQQQHSAIAGQSARLAEQARNLDRQAAEIAGQRAKIASLQTAIEELALRLAKLEGH
ncbi:MAG: tail fiber domain-containing protein [Acidobacteria bacterium]|nr:tail fiber domain-containing protein [Acidobacteriota bacterium]